MNSGGGAGVAGINTAEVTAQLSEASKTAMSFLSSTVAALGEKVISEKKENESTREES